MNAGRRPTVPQVYALAGALCARAHERFPETRADASALIERLRRKLGQPTPALGDSPPRERGAEGQAEGQEVVAGSASGS
jgi:hypothetical protein